MDVFKKNYLDAHINYLSVSDEAFPDFESELSVLDIEKLMTKFTFDKIFSNQTENNDF